MFNFFHKIFTNKKLAIASITIIIIEIAWQSLAFEWDFSSYQLRTVWNPLITWLSVIYLNIFGLIFFKHAGLKVLLGYLSIPFILLPLVYLIFIGNRPIDTYTEPKDVYVLQTIDSHKKIVVREFENTMREKDYDTATVEEYFLFRKELSATRPHIEIWAP